MPKSYSCRTLKIVTDVVGELGDYHVKSQYMDVSKNSGFSPQIIHFLIGLFHYKPSILGYPYCWKHPYNAQKFKTVVVVDPTHLKDMLVKLDQSLRVIGVKIKNI